MKYGIRNNSLKQEWDEAYATAARIGFDGVEICVTKEEHMPRILEPAQRQRSKDLAAKAGVETCAISYGMLRQASFIDENPAARKRGVELMHKVIDAAKDMGCFGILCPTFDRQNIDLNKQQTEWYIECYKQCAPKAEREGEFVSSRSSPG